MANAGGSSPIALRAALRKEGYAAAARGLQRKDNPYLAEFRGAGVGARLGRSSKEVPGRQKARPIRLIGYAHNERRF
jgi:hypothetical protein